MLLVAVAAAAIEFALNAGTVAESSSKSSGDDATELALLLLPLTTFSMNALVE